MAYYRNKALENEPSVYCKKCNSPINKHGYQMSKKAYRQRLYCGMKCANNPAGLTADEISRLREELVGV